MSPEQVFNVILNEVKGFIVIFSEAADFIFIMNKFLLSSWASAKDLKGLDSSASLRMTKG